MRVPEEELEGLQAFAKARGVSEEQALKDALTLQKYVAEVIDGGGRLLIQRGDDERLREVAFW